MPGSLLDNGFVLAIVVAVGAFAATFALHRVFTALRKGIRRTLGRGADSSSGRATPAGAAAGAASPPQFAMAPGSATPPPRAVAPAAPAAAARPPARAAPASGGGRATLAGVEVHAPREAAPRAAAAPATAPMAPAESAAEAPPASEWERLVREVMSQESVLGENRGLSSRRSLLSLLSNIRDRELLYERGLRIGGGIHATDYSDLGEKLTRNNVCTEARFRKSALDSMEVRLVGTAMARDAPVIGTCVCFIESGLLAGAIGNLEGGRMEVREVKCAVKGDPFCEFTATRVAEAEAPTLYDGPAPEGGA